MALEEGEECEDAQVGHLTPDQAEGFVHQMALLCVQENLFVGVTLFHQVTNHLKTEQEP